MAVDPEQREQFERNVAAASLRGWYAYAALARAIMALADAVEGASHG